MDFGAAVSLPLGGSTVVGVSWAPPLQQLLPQHALQQHLPPQPPLEAAPQQQLQQQQRAFPRNIL